MTLTLADIKRSIQGPPRIVIYGVPGIGKTTFACGAPSPVVLNIEDGLGELDVPTMPIPEAYPQVLEQVGFLVKEDHPFQTAVIDSLDKLEPMLWSYVCTQAGKKSIEDFGYGKGYVAAAAEWRNLLSGFDALRARGMATVLVAHSAVVRVDPPDTDPYDRYQLRLHKTADALICDWADVVLFANYDVKTIVSGSGDTARKRGISDGTRILHTVERAAWRAKNRYGLPDKLQLSWADLQKHMVKPAPTMATTTP